MTDPNETNMPEAAPEPVRAVLALGLMDTLSDHDLAEQVIDHSEAPIELALAWRLLKATKTLREQEAELAVHEELAWRAANPGVLR
jgi:hypothetical protein